MSTVPFDALTQRSTADSAVSSVVQAAARLRSIDVLRGLVIVLMALDHVRDYFTEVRFSPLDLSQTNALLFMTRWVTHLCAPTFIFLAGVSAYLLSRRYEVQQLRRFLVTRGLWLIVLEFTVIQFAWSFNLKYEFGLVMQVMWVIGASMIVLAGLVSWPRWAIGAFAVVVIGAHNLLDNVQPTDFGSWASLWNVLHVQGQTSFGFVLYPLVPWIGVMAAGFYAGQAFDLDEQHRRTILIRAGAFCLVLFVVLRAINGYGDAQHWALQSTFGMSLLSFLNVTKYPPSLLYLLAMLGFAALLLAAFETTRGKLTDILQTFGRVPLFFYVLHIALAHLLAGLIAIATGFGNQILLNVFLFPPDRWGFGLPVIYFAWAIVVAALYPACVWFADVKRRRKDWWLSYL
jgi:uncharacterized membrane protein